MVVCTAHTLGGSPRLAGRRLAVGDIISSLSIYEEVIEVMQEYELSLEQVRQALQYCAGQYCLVDKPVVFCHNCSLRSKQEKALDIADLEEIDGKIVGKGIVFFGTMEELLIEWQGQDSHEPPRPPAPRARRIAVPRRCARAAGHALRGRVRVAAGAWHPEKP
nr:hypothetical protein [Tanacetum cinerariifolium]